jgi:response regulator RpfG family c-di-GMP phosphodiesterase/uncharacterized protein YigA (DUF484 family)
VAINQLKLKIFGTQFNQLLSEFKDEREQAVRVLILIGLVFSVSGALFALLQLLTIPFAKSYSFAWMDILIDLSVALFGIVVIGLTKSRHIQTAKSMVLGGFLFFATFQTYLSGNPSANISGALAMILFVLMSAVLINERNPWLAFALAASLYGGLNLLWLLGLLPEAPAREPSSQALFTFIVWLTVCGLLTAGISHSLHVLRQQTATLQQNLSIQQQAEKKITHNLLVQEVLQEISSQALQTTNEDTLIEYVTELLYSKLYSDELGILLYDQNQQKLTFHPSYQGISEEDKRNTYVIGEGVIGNVALVKQPIIIHDTQESAIYIPGKGEKMYSELCVPLLIENQIIGVINAESRLPHYFEDKDEGFLLTVANQLGMAIERIRLFNKEMQLRMETEVQHEISLALTQSTSLENMLENFLENLSRILESDSSSIFLWERDQLKIVASRGFDKTELSPQLDHSTNDQLFQAICSSKKPLILENAEEDQRFQKFEGMDPIHGWMGVPLIDQGEVFGIVTLDSRTTGKYDDAMARQAQNIVNQVSQTIIKAKLFESTNIRLHRLQALHTIHQIFSASVDLNLSLNQFLQIVVKQLQVDAAAILFYNPIQLSLQYANSLGFKTEALRHTNLKIGEGYAGQAILERKIVRVDDLQTVDVNFSRSEVFVNEGFQVYIGVPLINRDQVIGALELFHRSPLSPDAEWEEFLMSLSTQAAIATENLHLLSNAQKTNMALNLAFDSTLSGMARALDKRKQLPEGHSERLADMTTKLADKYNVPPERIIHIRRGVYLYDIGLIGIPDRVLEKTNQLTSDEKQILKQNPLLAQQTLGNVPFLQPAIDIPYCYHENWDGSGYPRGLKEREIPLAARLFSVVNTFLTMGIDRPYRNAWQKEQIITYLIDQAGRKFDPDVVEAFLELLKSEGEY